jgi:hypothetical protein
LTLRVRLLAVLAGILRMSLSVGGVFFAFCVIAFAVVFGGFAMRFGGILVMLGSLIVFVSSHWKSPIIVDGTNGNRVRQQLVPTSDRSKSNF